MSNDTEFLYSGESAGSEDMKIVRMARRVREMRIRTPQAHCAVVGLLSNKLLMGPKEDMEKDRGAIKDTLGRVRLKLIQCGLGEDGIRVYVPYKCVPIERPGQVVLYAIDAAPRPAAPYMWDRQPPIQAAPQAELEASLNMEFDVKAYEAEKEKKGDDSLITCQVEVAIWDAKTNTRMVQHLPEAKVSLKVGPGGIEEVSGELTALKVKIKALNLADKFKWGFINKVEVSFKGEVGLEFKSQGKDQMNRLFTEWQAKTKVSLSFDLQIPKTSLKLPIEISPYIDQAGSVGVGVQIKILDF